MVRLASAHLQHLAVPMPVSAATVSVDHSAQGGKLGHIATMNTHRFARLMLGAFVLLAVLALWAPTIAGAQPVVRESFDAWQIQCETPTGSDVELCALVQNVAAVDRPNVELRVTVVRTLDGGAHILRVAAPLGVLLDGGLGLRIDDTDIGTADFARCLPSGCYVEMIMEQELVNTLTTGTTAWFVIFQTPDEGIGIPIELAGFGAGFAALN